MTGSVASVLGTKLIRAMQAIGNVRVVLTPRALNFYSQHMMDVAGIDKSDVYFDDVVGPNSEWKFTGHFSGDQTKGVYRSVWEKGDRVLHIDLRKWADVLVIAPLSANTLANMAYGMCDNLLTTIFRAWDITKPVVVAPAMNTMMWEHPFTAEQLKMLQKMFLGGGGTNNFIWVEPTEKGLACGETGKGAMAMIPDIVETTIYATKWVFPLSTGPANCPGIPINFHPGAFGFHRKFCYHTGVDLYAKTPGASVFAVEGGTVINIEHFTGPQDGTPWWNNTEAILVEGRSGVVCYGEVELLPYLDIKVGSKVRRGQPIAKVAQVLPDHKFRPDIPGHSTSMLHFELYRAGTKQCSHSWKHDKPMHGYMTDPTPLLMEAINAPAERLVWENPEALQGGSENVCGCKEEHHQAG
jgi:phosphopantothenoylcysteine decarboxylase